MKFIKDLGKDSYLVELEDGTRGTMNKFSRNFNPFPDSTATSPLYGESEENIEAFSMDDAVSVGDRFDNLKNLTGDALGETREGPFPEEELTGLFKKMMDAAVRPATDPNPVLYEELKENINYDLGAQTDEAGKTIFPDLENKPLTEILPQVAKSIRTNTFDSGFVKNMISNSIQTNDPGMSSLSSDIAVLALIGPKLKTMFKGLSKVEDMMRQGISMIKAYKKGGNKELEKWAGEKNVDPETFRGPVSEAYKIVEKLEAKGPKEFGPNWQKNLDSDLVGFYDHVLRGTKTPSAQDVAKYDQQRAIMTHLLEMDDMNIMEQSSVPSDENSMDLGTMDVPKNRYQR